MQNSNEGKLNICVLPSGRAYVGICAKIGGRVEIPTEYDGHPVSHITEKAFSDSCAREVYIPSSVVSISRNAFCFCQGVIIYCQAKEKPENWDDDWNVVGFRTRAAVVWDCDNNDVASDGFVYTEFNGMRYKLKDGVATVGNQQHDITLANIPEFITYKGVEYPVTSISDYAFSGCHQLKAVHLPDNMRKIGNGAFFNCHSLDEGGVHVKEVVTWCRITFPYSDEANPLYHGKRLYVDGELLTKITVPEEIKDISPYAFAYSTSIEQIVLPSGVRSIGYMAFCNCSNLRSVNIPQSVSEIAGNAFEYCDKLTVYCEREESADSWDERWNRMNNFATVNTVFGVK